MYNLLFELKKFFEAKQLEEKVGIEYVKNEREKKWKFHVTDRRGKTNELFTVELVDGDYSEVCFAFEKEVFPNEELEDKLKEMLVRYIEKN